MKKIIFTIVIILLLFFCFRVFYIVGVGDVFSRGLSNGMIFPKQGNFFLARLNTDMKFDSYTWYVSTLNNHNSMKPLSDFALAGSLNVFSPNGTKIVGKNKNNFVIYNLVSNDEKLIKIDDKFNYYGDHGNVLLDWLDENTIVYSCPIPGTGVEWSSFSVRYCYLDINTEDVKTTATPPNLNKNVIDKSQNKADGCYYNLDKTMCASENGRFHIYEGSLISEIWIKEKNKNRLIYRNGNRPGNMYWANDNSLYIELVSQGDGSILRLKL